MQLVLLGRWGDFRRWDEYHCWNLLARPGRQWGHSVTPPHGDLIQAALPRGLKSPCGDGGLHAQVITDVSG